MTTAVSIWLALMLGASAGLKAWRIEESASALSTYSITSPSAQHLSAWLLVSVELCLEDH